MEAKQTADPRLREGVTPDRHPDSSHERGCTRPHCGRFSQGHGPAARRQALSAGGSGAGGQRVPSGGGERRPSSRTGCRLPVTRRGPAAARCNGPRQRPQRAPTAAAPRAPRRNPRPATFTRPPRARRGGGVTTRPAPPRAIPLTSTRAPGRAPRRPPRTTLLEAARSRGGPAQASSQHLRGGPAEIHGGSDSERRPRAARHREAATAAEDTGSPRPPPMRKGGAAEGRGHPKSRPRHIPVHLEGPAARSVRGRWGRRYGTALCPVPEAKPPLQSWEVSPRVVAPCTEHRCTACRRGSVCSEVIHSRQHSALRTRSQERLEKRGVLGKI